MKKYELTLFFVVLLVSCNKDDEGGGNSNPKYKGEHSLIIDKVDASGFGAIIVSGTFNITYDPSIQEIGFILTNERDKTEIRKQLNLDQLRSKETITFNNLTDGNYSVKAYLINGNNNEIYSQSKSISLNTNSTSDYFLLCIYDYINEVGNPVLSLNTNDYFLISLVSKNPITSEKVAIKLADEIFEANLEESTGWTDGLWHYDIYGSINANMPDGQNMIEVIFQNQVSFITGIILDKLPGRWERLNSLFPGEIRYGTKISFQNEKYGFLLQDENISWQSNGFTVWRLDFSNLQWKQMAPLQLPENTYRVESFPTQITRENKVYIIFIVQHNKYEWHGGEEYYMGDEYFVEVWEYNMTTDVWSQKTQLEIPIPNQPLVFACKNKFYIMGGYGNTGIPSDKQWIYDIESNSVKESKCTAPIEYYAGYYYSTFESDNYTYIISGFYDTSGLSTGIECIVFRYSGKKDTWEIIKSPYPLMSGQGTGFTFNNLIYYVGSNAFPYCYTYSETNNKWDQIADFPFDIKQGIAFKFNSKAYVGLGNGYYDSEITLYSYEK